MTTLFESTIPADAPELMCASRYVEYLRTEGQKTLPHGDLPRALQHDLSRFAAAKKGAEMLAVMAACVRHGQRLTIQLRCAGRVVPLTVFPRERLAYSPLPIETLIAMPLAEMRIIHLEPANIQPPDSDQAPIGAARLYRPLAPLLWAMAMRGPTAALLPEIAGAAAYRVAPSIDLSPVLNSGLLTNAVQRLRRETSNLRSLSEWPGLDRERASRLLNAIYLQSALIVTRSHPEASSDHWLGALSPR
jgi:hypothetical protein